MALLWNGGCEPEPPLRDRARLCRPARTARHVLHNLLNAGVHPRVVQELMRNSEHQADDESLPRPVATSVGRRARITAVAQAPAASGGIEPIARRRLKWKKMNRGRATSAASRPAFPC